MAVASFCRASSFFRTSAPVRDGTPILTDGFGSSAAPPAPIPPASMPLPSLEVAARPS